MAALFTNPYIWTVIAGGATGLATAGMDFVSTIGAEANLTYMADFLYQINDQLKSLQDRADKQRVVELYNSMNPQHTINLDTYNENPERYTSYISDYMNSSMNNTTNSLQTKTDSNGKSWILGTISSAVIKLLTMIKELVNEGKFKFDILPDEDSLKASYQELVVKAKNSDDSISTQLLKNITSGTLQQFRQSGPLYAFPEFEANMYYIQAVLVMFNYKHTAPGSDMYYELIWFTSKEKITNITTTFSNIKDGGFNKCTLDFKLFGESGNELKLVNGYTYGRSERLYYLWQLNNDSTVTKTDKFELKNSSLSYTVEDYDYNDDTTYNPKDMVSYWYINNMTYDGTNYHYKSGTSKSSTTKALTAKIRPFDAARSAGKSLAERIEDIDDYDLTISVPKEGFEGKVKRLADAIASDNPVSVSKALEDIGIVAADKTTSKPLDTTYPDVQDGIKGNESIKNGSTTVEIPEVTPIATNGFVSIYKMSDSGMNLLGGYLWSPDFVDSITKVFGDPIDSLITAYMMPASFSGTLKTVKIGNVHLTNINGWELSSTIQEMDLGSIRIPNSFNSFLDYEPFTKINLYLPFIGMVQLSTNDVMGGVINIKYKFDMLTGSCLAQVFVTNKYLNNANMYQYTGSAAVSLPITSANYSRIFGSAIATIGSAAGAIATGGATLAGTALMAGTSALTSGVDIKRSGSMTSNTGALGGMKPYVVISRPVSEQPMNYNNLIGNMSNKYAKVSNLTGYNELESFKLNVPDATEAEKAEIETILKSGFYA
jgi:hypothetical protein